MSKEVQGKKQVVPIEFIVLDAGTQHRPIDEETLNAYIELAKEKVKFPPVDIIRVEGKFILTDGFHRIEVQKRLKKKKIEAFVKDGTMNDALWDSYAANTQHGKPLTPQQRIILVEEMLISKAFRSKSLSAIGRQVGLTTARISQIKTKFMNKLKAEQQPKPAQEKAEKVDSEPKNEGYRLNHLNDRDEKITVTRGGTTYKQKSQEKEQKKPSPLKDRVGQTIPEHLVALWERRPELRGYLTRLKNIYDETVEAMKKRDPLYAFIHDNALEVNFKNLRQSYLAAIPYAVCPYCAGKGTKCKPCRNTGLLNKSCYAVVIDELKAKNSKK